MRTVQRRHEPGGTRLELEVRAVPTPRVEPESWRELQQLRARRTVGRVAEQPGRWLAQKNRAQVSARPHLHNMRPRVLPGRAEPDLVHQMPRGRVLSRYRLTSVPLNSAATYLQYRLFPQKLNSAATEPHCRLIAVPCKSSAAEFHCCLPPVLLNSTAAQLRCRLTPLSLVSAATELRSCLIVLLLNSAAV